MIHGIPEDEEHPRRILKDVLLPLCEELQKTVAEVKELDLTAEQVTVFFPPDRLLDGLGEEIIIFINGLFVNSERTDEVRNILAQKVGKKVREHYPESLVECFIQPFDPKGGFWSSIN